MLRDKHFHYEKKHEKETYTRKLGGGKLTRLQLHRRLSKFELHNFTFVPFVVFVGAHESCDPRWSARGQYVGAQRLR